MKDYEFVMTEEDLSQAVLLYLKVIRKKEIDRYANVEYTVFSYESGKVRIEGTLRGKKEV